MRKLLLWLEGHHAGGRKRRVEGNPDVKVHHAELLAVACGFPETIQGKGRAPFLLERTNFRYGKSLTDIKGW